MPFCQICASWARENVFAESPFGPECWYPLHNNLVSFFESLTRKCPICNRIYHLLSEEGKRHFELIHDCVANGILAEGRAESVVRLRPLFFGWGKDRELILNVEICQSYFESLHSVGDSEIPVDVKASIAYMLDELRRYNMVGSNIFMTSQLAITSQDAKWKRPSSLSTASEETMSVIERWIQECTTKHPQCINRRKKERWYPTRLLDVRGDLASPCIESCRLTCGNEIANGEQYMTLSHRWGSYAIARLKTITIDEWRISLPLRLLSKTFQDFISLSRRMNIRYVWIDSLCIIQEGDSGADWNEEAPTMADVYTNAFCNISADWGSEQNGLFFDRYPEDFDVPSLDFTIDGEGVESTEPMVIVDGPAAGFWNDQVTHSPLNKRAWVLQERLLSCRNVHFCPQEVLFECCETAACERYPDGLPLPEFSGDAPLPKIFEWSKENEYVNSLTERWKYAGARSETAHAIWADNVTQYSSCQLTFGSDKLIAVAGLAKYFEAARNDIYVTGLWAKNIAAEMAWHRSWVNPRVHHFQRNVAVATQSSQGSATYRAPSFSWAAIDFPVTAADSLARGILPHVRCIKYRSGLNDTVHTVTQSIFGPLSTPSVELQVTGCLKRTTLQKVESRVFAIPFTERGAVQLWPVNLDTIADTEDIKHLEGQILYYMPWQVDDESDVPKFVAIFFELENLQMARFRRIGIMRCEQGPLKELYMREQEGEPDLPCEIYDRKARKHTVYVV
ncbi:heterokaryon incompatibility protein-domain-containing protein [Xylariaceae sp. FL1272]|nr:heterokaryon incompatibility protein-domain-containing protein [Xylariaceae sp. FL1272]